MSRLPSHNPATRLLVALVVAALAGVSPCRGQDVDDSPAGLLESYLRERGLDHLLAEHLRERLKHAAGAQRGEIASRLARVYADLLAQAKPGPERDALVLASGELLDMNPSADTFDLRIALIRARYLTAEQTAERARLGLADDTAVRDAEGTFEAISGELVRLGSRADRRVGALERRERAGGVKDLFTLRSDLAEARRQRSLSKYYAGWSLYYHAMLTGSKAEAGDAIKQFGFILGADGKDPTLDQMPRSLLRYEHVARAVMGVALCRSLRGEHVSAVMWFDALEGEDDVHPGVREQMFSRQIAVLAAARRWDTLARAVERRRGAPLDDKAADPMKNNEARLLALLSLEAARAPDADEQRRRATEPLVRAALSDLIARGSIALVLDLTERFGTLPLGDEGFIGLYVRGLRLYRDARRAHAESGPDDTEPTRDPALVAGYLKAADLLAHAFESTEAGTFTDEHAAAGLMLGMALYYKDSPAEAAERFEQTAALLEPGEKHAEALWMAIVASERAIEQGRTDLESNLHADATLFVRIYPGDDRSARLLLRFADRGLFDRRTVLSVLLGVPPDSSMYTPARRHAADLLYREYTSAKEPARSELAGRFIPIAFDLIEPVLRSLRSSATPVGAGSIDAALLRVRQVLDAALTPTVTDPEAARRALGVLDEIRVRTGHDPAGRLAGELAYRRLQYALAVGDADAQKRAHEQLAQIGGPFLHAADRFLFSRAAERWLQTRNADDAAGVVRIGTRLIGGGEIARASLRTADTTARAATAVWRVRHDRAMLDTAIGIDRRVRGQHTPTADLLRRLGRNAEDAGDIDLAHAVWAQLASSIAAGGDGWYEARYKTIETLARRRPDEALKALRQHKMLYPDFAPEPWGSRFAVLMRRLEAGEGVP